MPKVRDDFKNLFRPLDADERLRLRTSLETDGCRDPIVVWAEEDTILDGHNRSLICDSLGIPYTETRISLPDETAARKWIIHNQLARRNLTPNELSFLRGLRYEAEKQPHGGPRQDANFASCSASDSLAAEFGVSERTIHNDAEFARQVQAASEKFGEQAKIDILKGAVVKARLDELIEKPAWEPVLLSTKDNWWTPEKYVSAVRAVMGTIDLDPASCEQANETVQAARIYDGKTNGDGLSLPWAGKVFLNPPYGKLGPAFVGRLYEFLGSGVTEAILLVNSRATDSDWFQPCFNGMICFTDHRIDFDSPDDKDTSSTHGSCFVYFGPNKDRFAEIFAEFGNVVRRY